jgi:hypothetical protein
VGSLGAELGTGIGLEDACEIPALNDDLVLRLLPSDSDVDGLVDDDDDEATGDVRALSKESSLTSSELSELRARLFLSLPVKPLGLLTVLVVPFELG